MKKIIVMVGLCFAMSSQAEQLVEYQFTGGSATPTTTGSLLLSASNWDYSSLADSGISSFSESAYARTYNTPVLNTFKAESSTAYHSITLTAASTMGADEMLRIDSLSFDTFATGWSNTHYQVAVYSDRSGNTQLALADWTGTTGTNCTSDVSEQNITLTNGESVVLSYYFADNNDVGDQNIHRLDNVEVYGSVVAIPEPPTAPTNLTATVTNTITTTDFDDVLLEWSDNSTNEFGFTIYQSNNGSNGTYLAIYTNAVDATTYTVPDLAVGTYWFRVAAYNTGGESGYAMTSTGVTVEPSESPLITNGGFETGDLSGWTGSATINSSSPISGSYDAIIGATSNSLYQAGLDITNPVTLTFDFVMPDPGGSGNRGLNLYLWSGETSNLEKLNIRVINDDGGLGDLQVHNGSAWTNLTSLQNVVNFGTSNSFRLTINSYGEANTPALNYDITVNSTTQAGINTAQAEGASSFNRVNAVNFSGQYSQVDYRIDNVALQIVSSLPVVPAAPTGLTATVTNTITTANFDDVLLEWSDNSTNEYGFTIYQSNNGSNGTYSAIYTNFANATTYTVPDLTNGTYWFRVAAYNTGGESAYSTTSAVVTDEMTAPAAPASLTATLTNTVTSTYFNDVLLEWNDNSTDEDGFTIYQSTDGSNGTYSVIHTSAADATTYTVPDLSTGTYWFRVAAYNTAGESDYAMTSTGVTVEIPEIINGDFELGDLSGWVNNSGSSATINSNSPISGNYDAVVESGGGQTDGTGLYQTGLNITDPVTLTFDFVMADPGTSRGLNLYLWSGETAVKEKLNIRVTNSDGGLGDLQAYSGSAWVNLTNLQNVIHFGTSNSFSLTINSYGEANSTNLNYDITVNSTTQTGINTAHAEASSSFTRLNAVDFSGYWASVDYRIDNVALHAVSEPPAGPSESPVMDAHVVSDNQIILSWPDGFSYNVLTNSDLTNTNGWNVMINSGSPVTNDFGNEGQLFYKLEYQP